MAEPKKKTTPKKTSPGAKKTTAKKVPTKKAPLKKAPVVVKAEASSSAVKKAAPRKKTAPKKTSPRAKKTTAKKAPTKKVVSEKVKMAPHFVKELIPEPTAKKEKTKMDTSMFTTVLALFIVALVVLGGYIYSRQSRMMEPPAPPAVPVTESNTQNIRISSSVVLTPEVKTALENIVTQIAIGPDEVLENVRMISDVRAAQSESPDFFANVQEGDYVFQFKSASLLYRPSTTEIVKTGILPSQPVQ